MKRALASSIAAAAAAAAAACSLILNTNDNQCSQDADCSAFGGARLCSQGLCVLAPDEGGAPGSLDGGGGSDAAAPPGEAAAPPGDGGTPGEAGGADGSQPISAAAANDRADEAVEAMLLAFWSQKLGYLSVDPNTSTGPTGYWTFAQAWDAVLDAAGRHADGRFVGMIYTFLTAQQPPGPGFTSQFYDDENWMTLALLRAYDITKDSTFLLQAQTLFNNDIMAAWDTTCCGAVPGGVWWDRAHTQKATASNAGVVITAARLYEHTKSQAYMDFAKQVYDYWLANMVDPATSEVIDHITADAPDAGGQKIHYKYTYNQGLMIGAAVELTAATSDASYLATAQKIAAYLESKETVTSSVGAVLYDGSNTTCTGDCAQFKGIAARYLASLYLADATHGEHLQLLQASAEGAYSLARNPSSRLYQSDWSVPYATSSSVSVLNATSSAAMALSAVASIAGAPTGDPANVYEAEEGTLHAVGLEANPKNTGFDGWGYVAGWNAGGQWVDFHVTAPTTGTYSLAFRYAAGGGDAARQVYANRGTVVASQPFANTGGWGAYGTVTVQATLNAGANVVSLIFDSSGASPSTGFVNLDNLTVTAHP